MGFSDNKDFSVKELHKDYQKLFENLNAHYHQSQKLIEDIQNHPFASLRDVEYANSSQCIKGVTKVLGDKHFQILAKTLPTQQLEVLKPTGVLQRTTTIARNQLPSSLVNSTKLLSSQIQTATNFVYQKSLLENITSEWDQKYYKVVVSKADLDLTDPHRVFIEYTITVSNKQPIPDLEKLDAVAEIFSKADALQNFQKVNQKLFDLEQDLLAFINNLKNKINTLLVLQAKQKEEKRQLAIEEARKAFFDF